MYIQIPKNCFLYRIRNLSRNHKLTDQKINQIKRYITIKHIGFYISVLGSYSDLFT